MEVRPVEADLTTEAGHSAVEEVLRSSERVAVLVNNAGNGKLSSTAGMEDADAAATVALNVIAPTRLSRAVLPAFLRRDTSSIINISSVVALHALPITTPYSAIKSYVLTFSRGLAGELKGDRSQGTGGAARRDRHRVLRPFGHPAFGVQSGRGDNDGEPGRRSASRLRSRGKR